MNNKEKYIEELNSVKASESLKSRISASAIPSPKNKIRRLVPVAACAAVVIIIAVPTLASRLRMGSSKETAQNNAVDYAASEERKESYDAVCEEEIDSANDGRAAVSSVEYDYKVYKPSQDFYSMDDNNFAVTIRSSAQFETMLKKYFVSDENREYLSEGENIIDSYSRCDDEYFENHTILLVSQFEGSCSYDFTVDKVSVNNDGSADVNLTLIKPPVFDCAVGTYLIIIEVDNTYDISGEPNVRVSEKELPSESY